MSTGKRKHRSWADRAYNKRKRRPSKENYLMRESERIHQEQIRLKQEFLASEARRQGRAA